MRKAPHHLTRLLQSAFSPVLAFCMFSLPVPAYGTPTNHLHHTNRPRYNGANNQHMPGYGHSMTMSAESSTLSPMSFIMVPPAAPMMNMVAALGPQTPANVDMGFDNPVPHSSSVLGGNGGGNTSAMMMPSTMIMTIQSEPGGLSAIELSTSMASLASPSSSSGPTSGLAANASAPLIMYQRPVQQQSPSSKWVPLQQHQQQSFDYEDQSGGGEHYYTSPYGPRGGGSSAPQLASPAKLLRANEQSRTTGNSNSNSNRQPAPTRANRAMAKLVIQPQQQQHQHHQQQQQHPTQMPKTSRVVQVNSVSGRLQQAGKTTTEWRAIHTMADPTQQPQLQARTRQQHPLDNNQLESEELIQAGPPQLIPIYQTANGQLHMSPPSGTVDQQSGFQNR